MTFNLNEIAKAKEVFEIFKTFFPNSNPTLKIVECEGPDGISETKILVKR